MSTDSQNPRYSYLTLNRSIVGTDSFELDVAGSTVYRLDTNTSTVNIKFNNSGNDEIPLISKRRIDVGSNGFTKIIVSWTGIAVAETLQLLIADSEASSTDIGVELSDYSTSLTGAITIGGTVDVDIVGQTGADPLNVTSTITGTSDFNLNEINGSTTPITELTNILQANNPDATRIIKFTQLATGASTIIYTVPTGKTLYITNAWISMFGLSDLDSGGLLMHRDSTPTDIGALLQLGMQDLQGTFAYSTSYPIPYKLNAGDDLELQTDANSWTATGITGILV
tara:strand:+ start:2376 stop:3224 length:849 start_codon:yes stop_codon:yes gene_type:complete